MDANASTDVVGTVMEGRQVGKWHHWKAVVLPLLLWWTACFFLLGDLGKWLDDYGFHRRDPVSGGFKGRDLLDMAWGGGFWRPLHIGTCRALQTLLWHHGQLLHLICAIAHGVACLALWRLLLAVGISRAVSSGVSLLFLTCPVAYEAIFWPSTVSTSIATTLMLVIMLMCVTLARGGRGAFVIPGMVVLSFSAMCWYEQALAGVVAMPLFYLSSKSATESWSRSVCRTGVSTGACVLAVVVYVLLMTQTVHGDMRGGSHSFTPLGEFADKTGFIADQVWQHLTMANFLSGAMREGWNRIGARTWVGPIWILLICIASGAWVWWFKRQLADDTMWRGKEGTYGRCGGHEPRVRGLAFVLLGGLVIFLVAWLPAVLIKSQWVVPRMCYVPLVGLAVAVAALLEMTRGLIGSQWRSAFGMVMGWAIILAALGGSIALVGVQSGFQLRSHMDQLEFEQLRTLVPTPPPNTVFIPLKIENWPTHTGSSRFDMFARGVWELPWSANESVKHLYRRLDVFATFFNRWGPLPLDNVTDVDFVYRHAWFSPYLPMQSGGYLIQWVAVVPFTVDIAGKLELVSRIVIKRSGGKQQDVMLPLSEEAYRLQGVRGGEFVLDLSDGG